MLAGLFPPPDEDEDSPLDVWQPIPVHMVPRKEETMLGGGPDDCDPYDEHRKEVMSADPVFMSYMRNRSEVAKKILKVTGWGEIEDPYDAFYKLASIHDTLFCENATAGMPLKKEFVEQNIFEDSKQFGDLEWLSFNLLTRQLKRMVGGVLMSDLKHRVRDAIEDKNKLRLIMYSAHDTTLAGILTCLGVYDGIQTPYATVLMLELWKKSSGTWEVRLNRHHAHEPLITYKLPGCGDTGCTPEEFYAINTDYDYSSEEFLQYCNGVEILPGVTKSKCPIYNARYDGPSIPMYHYYTDRIRGITLQEIFRSLQLCQSVTITCQSIGLTATVVFIVFILTSYLVW
eukprot:sb/3466371/